MTVRWGKCLENVKTQKIPLLRVVRREIERVDEYFKNCSEAKKKKKYSAPTNIQKYVPSVAGIIMTPSLNYVHILIPDPLNVLAYMARGDGGIKIADEIKVDLEMWQVSWINQAGPR